MQEIIGIYDEFKRIRILLNDPDEYEDLKIEEFQKSQRIKQNKFYINAVSNFIIYIIAILEILSSI